MSVDDRPGVSAPRHPLVAACLFDLRVQGRVHALSAAVTTAAFALSAVTGVVYPAAVAAGVWASTTLTGFFAVRERDDLDTLQHTLGVSRHHAVDSRYVVVATLVALMCAGFGVLLIVRSPWTPAHAQSPASGVGFMALVTLYAAALLAAWFRRASAVVRQVVTLAFVTVLVGPALATVAAGGPMPLAWAESVNPLSVSVVAAAAVAYVASWLSTRRALARRDL